MANDDPTGQQGDPAAGDGQQGTPQGTPAGQQGTPAAGDGGQGDTTDWRAEARKWEKRAKDNAAAAKQLTDLQASQQTAEERAQAAAQQAEARATAAVRRVASAEVRAALTGVVPDPSAVVEDLDLSRFIDADSGEVNAEAVASLKAKYAALAPQTGPRAPAHNPAQGQSSQPKSLLEIIAERERASTGTRSETTDLLGAKSRLLLGGQQ